MFAINDMTPDKRQYSTVRGSVYGVEESLVVEGYVVVRGNGDRVIWQDRWWISRASGLIEISDPDLQIDNYLELRQKILQEWA